MPTLRKYSSRSQQTTLTSAVTAGGTTIVVGSGASLLGGATVTSPEIFTVVINPDTALEEIVDVTAVSTNTLTIQRGRDGSSGQNHSAGAVVRHMAIGRDYREANDHINDTTTAHGVTGAVVGTTNSQTLTNKTLTNPIVTTGSFSTPTIAGATISGAFTSTATITGGTISGAVVTGLTSSSLADTQATPKNYVDAFFGPLTSALTSATSAATSATSAATSATSAASSASAAATSASSALTSQTAAATSATSAAASATAAATSATSAATSATSSATSASAAATSASSAATSAGSSETSAIASATSASAAATSASSAATSASSSAASTSAAAASASAAATSATSASASQTAAATSATSAATSASSALTSQTAAATSATSASISQSDAATNAASAATSASSAATSASSAATTYDNFDDRYLGPKSSAPTVDNDGNTLLVGAIYWDTTQNKMYVWSGTVWVQIATTASYSAPTIGSQTIASGTTYTTIAGLTLSGGLAAADPTANLGLATKQYVDAVTASQNFHAPVVAASTTNSGVIYNNGTSGVGATLTADTNRALTTLDGASVALNDRVLIKNQTDQTQNGIYTLTTVGSGSVPFVLTRAVDSDNSIAGEMRNGDIVFCVSGTINGGVTFVNASADNPIVIGTSSIVYSEFSNALPTQTGNTGRYLYTDGTTDSWQPATGASSGTYTATTIVVDANGRISSISTGASGGAQLYDTLMLMGA